MSGTVDLAMYRVLLQIATNTSSGGSAVTINAPKGQTTMVNSIPVVLASDESNVPVSVQGTPNVAVTNTPAVLPQVGTTGGAGSNHAISAATTNGTNIKNSAGNLYGLQISNTNAAARYFKLYNLAVAPTVGSSTVYKTIQIPANSTVIAAFPEGLSFSTGISYAATTNMADADATAIGAGDLSMDVDFK